MNPPALYCLIAWLLGAPAAVAQPAAAVVGPERPELYARVLVWAEHESRYGAALAGHRWDHQAWGVLQIRGRPDLERDVGRSVRVWVWMVERGAEACGSLTGGLRMVSSGSCKLATHLVDEREREADLALSWAYAAAWRSP